MCPALEVYLQSELLLMLQVRGFITEIADSSRLFVNLSDSAQKKEVNLLNDLVLKKSTF